MSCHCGLRGLSWREQFLHILQNTEHQDGRMSCPMCGMRFTNDHEGNRLFWKHADEKHADFDSKEEKLHCLLRCCNLKTKGEMSRRIHFGQVHLNPRNKAIIPRDPSQNYLDSEHPHSCEDHFPDSSYPDDLPYDPKKDPIILALKQDGYIHISLAEKFRGEETNGFGGPSRKGAPSVHHPSAIPNSKGHKSAVRFESAASTSKGGKKTPERDPKRQRK